MTSTKYIGLDVHKESISIAVLNDALPGLDRLRFAPTKIARGCGRVRSPEIGFHAGRKDLTRDRPAVDRDRILLDRRLDDLTESGRRAER